MNICCVTTGILVIFTSSCLGANILAVLPIPSASHQILLQPLFRELAVRGHNVTVIVDSNRLKEPLDNFTEVITPMTLNSKHHVQYLMKSLMGSGSMDAKMALLIGKTVCIDTLSNEQVQSILHSEQKFDLIMAEISLAQECYIGLSHRFKAPMVALTTFPGKETMEAYTGNPNPASYLPNWLAPFNEQMNFVERALNAFTIAQQLYQLYFHHLPMHEKIIKEYIPGADTMPPILDMLTNISLVLHNSQIGVTYARPYTPNIIEVGGMHISTKRTSLSPRLQEFMDNAKEGVIYFSLGSTISSKQIPDQTKQAFIEVFRNLKQKVLWKIDLDTLPDLPSNVMLAKWLPQHEILAHKNCKAFISHGGMLSVQEAIHFGVPLFGFPFFGDQHMNLAFVEYKRIGIKMDFNDITFESASWALNEILENPIYYNNMQKQSAIFNDHPLPPMENAIYWIEYVLRHGASHLQTPAARMSWFEYFLLDVFLIIFLVFFIILSVFVLICKSLYRYLFPKKQHKD